MGHQHKRSLATVCVTRYLHIRHLQLFFLRLDLIKTFDRAHFVTAPDKSYIRADKDLRLDNHGWGAGQ